MSSRMNLEISISSVSPPDEELIEEGIQEYFHDPKMSHDPTVSKAHLEKDPVGREHFTGKYLSHSEKASLL